MPNSSILNAVASFHTFSKIFGLTVFTVNPKNLQIKISVFDILFYSAAIIFQVCSYIHFWRTFKLLDSHSSEIVNLTVPILICMGMVVQLINTISQFFLKFKIFGIFQNIMDIDLKVNLK